MQMKRGSLKGKAFPLGPVRLGYYEENSPCGQARDTSSEKLEKPPGVPVGALEAFLRPPPPLFSRGHAFRRVFLLSG